jgi:hypothetical protein
MCRANRNRDFLIRLLLPAFPIWNPHLALKRLSCGVAREVVHDHDSGHPLVSCGNPAIDPIT